MSLISKAWLNIQLNEYKVSKIEEDLDPCDNLRVQCGNQVEIPFVGVELLTSILNLHVTETRSHSGFR